jgi:trehalose-6-phosphatase
MKTPLHFEAGIIDARFADERFAIEPGPAALLDTLRARGVRIIIAPPGRASPGEGGVPPSDPSHRPDRSPRVDPPRTFVIAREVDAIGRARQDGFGFVAGIATTTDTKRALREAGANLVVPSLADLTMDEIDAWFANREHARPALPAHRDAITRRLADSTPAIFLDYDGTLTPIVERPEFAVLAPEMRRILRNLAARAPIVIVSGRGREEVARLVGLEELIYVGSHGFDIAGPPPPAGRGTPAGPAASPSRGNSPIRREVAGALRPVMQRAAASLSTALAGIPGVVVEDKRFAVAVHYRQVAADRLAEIEAAVDRTLASCPDLKKSGGKKVLELRPAVDWDKGQAVLWLLQALDLETEEVVPVYLGDDTTDEDAFRALHDRGVTALVARTPRPTAAGYSLQDTDEVGDFLRFVDSLGSH